MDKIVILRKEMLSAKFGVMFPKDKPLRYSEILQSVEHPTKPHVWIGVQPKEFKDVTIIEQNKLIVLFMDKYFKIGKISPSALCSNGKYTQLKFHSSWDWLMPVIYKCLLICHNNMFNEWEESFADKFCLCELDALYNEVIEFITWCNENKIIENNLEM